MNVVAPTVLQAKASDFLSRAEAMPRQAERADAIALFARNGLPGPREEAWRYTPLRALAEAALDAEPGERDWHPMLPALDAPRLVFVQGRFRADLSMLPNFAVATGAPSFGTLARPQADKLVALNTMLAEDGAAIEVPAGIDAGSLLLVSLGGGAAFHPRHSIRLGAGARLTLIEISRGTGAYLHNPVMSVEVCAGATLTHLRLQEESAAAFHLSTVYADVAASATYDSFALNLGGLLARTEVHARLGGSKAAVHLNAAQLLGGRQHSDFTTVVRHDAPDTASRQTVKTVLTDRARGVFQGKIEVARIAQKTDGYQMNQALLLSDHAEMDSKPQLEIYADDVKCSHGATVGALDENQIFYLRSRGVAEAEARTMLVRAFLSEALDPIAHIDGRATMESAIGQWWDRQPR